MFSDHEGSDIMLLQAVCKVRTFCRRNWWAIMDMWMDHGWKVPKLPARSKNFKCLSVSKKIYDHFKCIYLLGRSSLYTSTTNLTSSVSPSPSKKNYCSWWERLSQMWCWTEFVWLSPQRLGCRLEFWNTPDLNWGYVQKGMSTGLYKMLEESRIDIMACSQYRSPSSFQVF